MKLTMTLLNQLFISLLQRAYWKAKLQKMCRREMQI